jgi:cytochrome P450
LEAFRSDRFGFLLRLARAYPDLARIRLSAFWALGTSSPALIHSLLVEHAEDLEKHNDLRQFAAPLLGQGLLLLERDEHRKHRRMLAPTFMSKRIASYAEEMTLRAERAIDRMCAEGTVDMSHECLRVTLEIVGKTLFDAELGREAGAIGHAVEEAMSCVMHSLSRPIPMPPIIPTRTNLRLRRTVARLDEVVYRMIRERRAAQEDRGDLLSVLLATRDQDDNSAFADREVRDEAMTLFLAGHETTANALAWTLYLLANHPAARERLEAEVDAAARQRTGPRFGASDLPQLGWTSQVVKEALRLYPPAYMITRRVRRTFEAEGQRFRRGQIVFLNIAGLHRRPDIYPNPEQFEPERFSPEREKALPRQAFMPFGGGPRICIGNHFAMMEAQLILATWIHALRFELVSGAHPGFEPLLTLRPARSILMRVRPRPAAAALASSPESVARSS